ncbi:ElyC/SanA/YdcF family protein [Litoribrevibacter albus]|uniref:Membrane protein n=1 Tax=Litoribrevibacter albus TaxID=1473156 RepID=A0AA37SDE2_9GAMM|nr:ElyC/SanA/YdcF family protein [Litoribrevibacter albus]GLQ33083.1 membrane protein [Litoribrevibacter albus]
MDVVFFIKKLVIVLISPISIVLILGLLALLALLWGKTKRAGVLMALSLFLVWAASFNPIGDSLMRSHEHGLRAFQYNDDLDVSVIHVLGGGHSESPRYATGAQLSSSSLARVIEGVRIAQLYPEARLVFSGYEGYMGVNKLTNAEAAKALATSIGMDEDRIDLLTEAKDTREEAIDVADMVGEGQLILVTSASHMPRALAIFHQEGLKPLPAPTYFLGHDQSSDYTPSIEALNKTQRYFYEQVGLMWIKLRAWLDQ